MTALYGIVPSGTLLQYSFTKKILHLQLRLMVFISKNLKIKEVDRFIKSVGCTEGVADRDGSDNFVVDMIMWTFEGTIDNAGLWIEALETVGIKESIGSLDGDAEE
eukprot:14511828-Ditylum_brightwellii.AAC.1